MIWLNQKYAFSNSGLQSNLAPAILSRTLRTSIRKFHTFFLESDRPNIFCNAVFKLYILRSVFRTQLNIYGEAFLRKTDFSCYLFLQKSSIVDVQLVLNMSLHSYAVIDLTSNKIQCVLWEFLLLQATFSEKLFWSKICYAKFSIITFELKRKNLTFAGCFIFAIVSYIWDATD